MHITDSWFYVASIHSHDHYIEHIRFVFMTPTFISISIFDETNRLSLHMHAYMFYLLGHVSYIEQGYKNEDKWYLGRILDRTKNANNRNQNLFEPNQNRARSPKNTMDTNDQHLAKPNLFHWLYRWTFFIYWGDK